MNWKQLGIGAVLVAFSAMTVETVYNYGYVGWLKMETANLTGVTLFVDLGIALTMVLVWMRQDAKERGISSLPYILITLFVGSVGPLLYMLRRESVTNVESPARPAAVRN